ncbi:hypothetical protein AB0J43_17645 [Nonomuraea fuscirosea]
METRPTPGVAASASNAAARTCVGVGNFVVFPYAEERPFPRRRAPGPMPGSA